MDDENFKVSTNSVTFAINDNLPVQSYTDGYASYLEGLLADIRLSNQPNFQFLPPINPKSTGGDLVGKYARWGPLTPLTIDTLMGEFAWYDKNGYKRTIKLDPTSYNNQIFCQVFEQTQTEIRKLDVIDYGKKIYRVPNESIFLNLHIFFVGRLLVDDRGDDTFIHLFTLVFSENELP